MMRYNSSRQTAVPRGRHLVTRISGLVFSMYTRSPQIDKAVENLVTACGFDNSESASEAFYYMLRDAVNNLAGEIEKSHAEGLCLDMTHSLASELTFLMASPKDPDIDPYDN